MFISIISNLLVYIPSLMIFSEGFEWCCPVSDGATGYQQGEVEEYSEYCQLSQFRILLWHCGY